MIDPLLLAAPVAGLFATGHCLPMCGGIAGLFSQGLSQRPPGERLLYLLSFNGGRLAMYATLGLLLGAGLGALKLALPMETLGTALRILAGLMLILMGLYVGRWWMGMTRLERLSQPLWRQVQPLALRLQRVPHLHGAFAAGALWGLLPCGLVYSALGTAAGSSQPALFMALFALGTWPALLTTGWLAASRPPQTRPGWRTVSALLLLALGSWSVLTAVWPQGHAGHGPAATQTAPAPDSGQEQSHPHHHRS